MGELIPLYGAGRGAPQPAPRAPRAPHVAPAAGGVPTSWPAYRSPEPLWRRLVGDELRRQRLRQGRTQADVAGRAGISTQYLSEIERGRKEPSSEILAAVGAALGLRLLDLTSGVSSTLASASPGPAHPTGPTCLAAVV